MERKKRNNPKVFYYFKKKKEKKIRFPSPIDQLLIDVRRSWKDPQKRKERVEKKSPCGLAVSIQHRFSLSGQDRGQNGDAEWPCPTLS